MCCTKKTCPLDCLNPFMNQVYFYMFPAMARSNKTKGVLIPLWIRSISTIREILTDKGFQALVLIPLWIRSISTRVLREALHWVCRLVLIPLWIRSISTPQCHMLFDQTGEICLNPFMNQVYFYTACGLMSVSWRIPVLIPLWIRSISTFLTKGGKEVTW